MGEFGKYVAIIVPVLMFVAAVGTAFWRLTKLEAAHEKLKEKQENELDSIEQKFEKKLQLVQDEVSANVRSINQSMHTQSQMFSQMMSEQSHEFKIEMSRLRADSVQEMEKIEKKIDAQREVSLAQHEFIRTKLDGMNEGVWAIKEKLAAQSPRT